jgi:type II secretory pathway predicted ATPase ExeA
VAQYEALTEVFRRTHNKGRRTLLIIDEAQNLSLEVLEELRLLSNVNTERNLILQILLVGQPELRRKLARPELQQFAQRVAVDFHLRPLDRSETHAYVRHRLAVAGRTTALFMPEAIEFIHARTRGVPRLMNQLCDFALLYAYADGRTMIDADLVAQVVRDRSTGVSLAMPTPVVAAPSALGTQKNPVSSAALPNSGPV